MKLSSLFPQTKTLANTVKTAPKKKPKASGLATLLPQTKKRPGEFNIKWPKFRTQQPKDYQVITTVKQLEEYIDRCEATGLGGFDYETAGDKDHRTEQDAKDKVALDPWKSEICAMSLSAAPDEARAIFISHKKGTKLFEPSLDRDVARRLLLDTLERRFFTNTKIMKIAVNLSFETKFTAKYGKYILMPVADPFTAWIRILQLVAPHKIKNPKRPYSGKGLKPMTYEVFGIKVNDFTEVLTKHGALFFDEVDADSQDALIYCCEDSDYAVQHYLYWDEIAKQIKNENPIYPTYSDWLHKIEMPFARVIGLMEYWGMYWDQNLSEVKRQEAEIMQEQAAEEIKRIAKETFDLDVDPGKSGKTNEVKSVIFDYMKLPAAAWSDKTGDPSLDANALMDMIFILENKLISIDEEKYLSVPLPEGWEGIDPETDPTLDKATRNRIRIAKRDPHPYRDQGIQLLKLLQKIQKYSTLLSSHIVGREKFLHEVTNRIHASYTPWTETARLNSFQPNGQNVPRPDNDEFKIRNFYRAPDGKILFLIDYSGFELRLMAWKSGDEVMIDAFKHNGDLHRKTASTMTRKPESEITKPERSNAKAGNFGISYGGTEHALQATFKKMGIRKSLDECKEIVDAVKRTYPRIPEYQREIVIKAREDGYVETIFGYKRLLPNINSTSGKARSSDERRAANTPIQGSAADIMKRSQVAVYEKIGLDTSSKNLGYKLQAYEGFITELRDLLNGPTIMEHGKTDMIAQIHDEIIFEFHDDPSLAKAAGDWVKAVMEIPPLPNFPIPIEAEASAAYSWGNKKDFSKWLEEKGAAS